MPQTNPSPLRWSDEPDPRWNQKAAISLTTRVMPHGHDATEIVLEGRCPRCGHQTLSTHPVRSLMSDKEAREQAAADDCPVGSGEGLRRVTARCRCRHDHPETPESEDGCGAPFALWVYWAQGDEAGLGREAKRWPAGATSLLDLEGELALQRWASSQLADVRRSAESWRTGLAGFLAILIAIFFIKGKESFDEIGGDGWKALMAALLLVAAGSALYGAYRALRAAYGIPQRRVPRRGLGPVSPDPKQIAEQPPRHLRLRNIQRVAARLGTPRGNGFAPCQGCDCRVGPSRGLGSSSHLVRARVIPKWAHDRRTGRATFRLDRPLNACAGAARDRTSDARPDQLLAA